MMVLLAFGAALPRAGTTSGCCFDGYLCHRADMVTRGTGRRQYYRAVAPKFINVFALELAQGNAFRLSSCCSGLLKVSMRIPSLPCGENQPRHGDPLSHDIRWDGGAAAD